MEAGRPDFEAFAAMARWGTTNVVVEEEDDDDEYAKLVRRMNPPRYIYIHTYTNSQLLYV